MSNCEDIRTRIDAGAWLDSSCEGFSEIEEHASTCPACARLLAELRGTESSVRAALEWADPGDGFNRRVLNAVRLRRRLLRGAVPLAAAAAVIFAILLSGLMTGGPQAGLRVVRSSGPLILAEGERAGKTVPFGADVVAAGSKVAFEVVHGVGFALRPQTTFRVSPACTEGYTRLDLKRGGAAVSVKTDRARANVEVGVNGFSVLTNDADFLVQTQTNGDRPALYVDRGRVVVGFAGGVTVVRSGEHVELEPAVLLSRLHADKTQMKVDLATLQAQCDELRLELARYEAMAKTYAAQWVERKSELEMAREALAFAPDEKTAQELEQRISKEDSRVKNLDLLMGEHIAKMSELRAELPKRLARLRGTRAMASRQVSELRRGLALLRGLK